MVHCLDEGIYAKNVYFSLQVRSFFFFFFFLLFAFLTFCAPLPEAAFDLKGVVGQVLLDSRSHSACDGCCCR